MNYLNVNQWLNHHHLELEESFPDALKKLALNYKHKNGCQSITEVYTMLEITKQNLSYWSLNLSNIQTKKTLSYHNTCI